jgi:hypothetical protein
MSRRASGLVRSTVLLLAAAAAGAAGPTGQQGQVWNLGTQQSGKTFPTQVSVFNESCRGAHDFTVAIQGEVARFLSITGPTELTDIRRGETKSTPARLDLRGAAAGAYEGEVVTRCTDCPPNCNLDYRTISVLLEVTAPAGASPRTADTTWQAPAPAPRTAETTWTPPPAGSPDPDGHCAFVPTVTPSWEGTPGGGPAIVERTGTHVLDLSPGSPLWTLVLTSERTAGTTWRPAAPSAPAVTRGAETTWDLAAQTRDLCLEHLDPCEELLARVRAAEEAYRDAQRRADAATGQEEYDEREAEALDEETARDRAYAETLRRQAAEWRQLAADARADAATNRDRAARHPEYADDWNRWAEADEARAAERDAEAARLEQEAQRIEDQIRDQSSAAGERRGRAEAARQAAAAALRALELARAEYEACLERQRLACEQERREAIAATQRAQAAATATATSSGGGTTARRGGAPAGGTPPPTSAPYSNFQSLPVRTAPFCQWVRFDVPYGTSTDKIRVVALSSRDTPSALEVRPMPSGTRSTGKGFDYHCKATTGSAVILFEQVSGEVARYKLRIGCVAE